LTLRGARVRPADYQSFHAAWLSCFETYEDAVRSACAELPAVRAFSLASAMPRQELEGLVRARWFQERVFDKFLWWSATQVKRRVLILCTGNIARSQMAEGWWRHLAGDDWDVFSAGTRPRRHVHPVAVEVMAERGVDISGQRPKSLDAFADRPFDVVLTVCSSAEAECPVFPNAARREHWPLDDPVIAGDDPQRQLAVFRRLRDELADRIRAYLDAFPV